MRFLIMITLIAGHFVSSDAYSYDKKIRADISHLTDSQKIFLRYYTASLLPWNLQDFEVTASRFKLNCENLSRTQCDRFSGYFDQNNLLEFSRARSTWMSHYLETRIERGNHTIIPDSIENFARISAYKTWPNEEIDSMVKATVRVIYTGQLDDRHISVAETIADDGSQQIREIELAVESKREPGNFDFYVYQPDGNLVLESEFPAGSRPAPLICVSCHMDRQSGKTERFIHK